MGIDQAQAQGAGTQQRQPKELERISLCLPCAGGTPSNRSNLENQHRSQPAHQRSGSSSSLPSSAAASCSTQGWVVQPPGCCVAKIVQRRHGSAEGAAQTTSGRWTARGTQSSLTWRRSRATAWCRPGPASLALDTTPPHLRSHEPSFLQWRWWCSGGRGDETVVFQWAVWRALACCSISRCMFAGLSTQ